MVNYIPAWKQVLIDAGYPVQPVVLDFETYFDIDFSLTKMSMIEYIMDKRFEILGVSIHEQTQPFTECQPIFWSGGHYNDQGQSEVETVIAYLQRMYGQNLEGCTFIAHNAYYDAMILALKFDIRPPFIVDTIGLHRHLNARASHTLSEIAIEEGLSEKGDTKQFKHWTFRTRRAKVSGRSKKRKIPTLQPKITSERLAALSYYANHDVELEWELFMRFLPRLSRPNFELPIMQHTINMWTTPRLAVDYEFGEQLATEMESQVDKLVKITGHTVGEIRGNLSFDALLTRVLAEVGEKPPYKPAKNKAGRILAIAKDDYERDLLLGHAHKPVRDLMAARVSTKSWPNHASRVRAIMAQCKATSDRLCVPLKYHGAHTGRWSGGEGINLQNLSARNPEPLINKVREIIVAPPGQCLVIADAAQIEARVLAWEAGQLDLCKRFADGEEIYALFASQVLGCPVRKPRKSDPGPVYKKHLWARNAVGKTGVLGCGYGMGPSKVMEYTKGQVDAVMAERIVDTYRRENDKIVEYWTDIENAFAISVKYGKEEQVGHLRIFPEPGFPHITVIELACGRWLRYYRPKVKGIGYHRTITVWNPKLKTQGHIWGGHLTENIIQAMSRDILAEAILKMESLGWHQALTVHDELIGVVPIKDGEQSLANAITCLSTSPDWAPDCPLAAEGVVSQRYGK